MKPFRALCATAMLFAAFGAVSSRAAELVRHIVCLKFKEGTKPEEIRRIEEAFRALKIKISEQVLNLEWGTNVSKENKDKGFTHCFVLTFADEKDVRAYAANPEHKAFAAMLAPIVDDIFVFDYHTRE